MLMLHEWDRLVFSTVQTLLRSLVTSSLALHPWSPCCSRQRCPLPRARSRTRGGCSPLSAGAEAECGPGEARAGTGATHGALRQDSARPPAPRPAGSGTHGQSWNFHPEHGQIRPAARHANELKAFQHWYN